MEIHTQSDGMTTAGRKVRFQQLRLPNHLCDQLDQRTCFLSHTSSYIHAAQTDIIRVKEEIPRQRRREGDNKGTHNYLHQN